MANKHFILTKKSCDILQAVKAEKNLKSETAALEYVLNEYAEKADFLNRISDIIDERIIIQMEKVIGPTALAAQNSELLLDSINTILVERGYNVCYSVDRNPSDVVKQAEGYRRKRIEKFKQRKDNRREL